MADFEFKVIVIGDTGVGKTCMVAKLMNNPISQTYVPTTVKAISKYTITFKGFNICLTFYDLSGDEKDRTNSTAYYYSSQFSCTLVYAFQGAIIGYSVTSETSLQNVQNWMKNIEKALTKEVSDNIAKVVVGLKSDCKVQEVNHENAVEMASFMGCKHFRCTCTEKESFREMLTELLDQMLMNHGVTLSQDETADNDSLIPKNEPQMFDCCCIL